MSENITISKTELVQLFKKVYEEGWYGSKDMAEVVAVKAVEDIDTEKNFNGAFAEELVAEADMYINERSHPSERRSSRYLGPANVVCGRCRHVTCTCLPGAGTIAAPSSNPSLNGFAYTGSSEGEFISELPQLEFHWSTHPDSNVEVNENSPIPQWSTILEYVEDAENADTQ